MVNMAGGVMENAGLCLDRFGLPYIPGSAVKGCARRTALAALREWCETGQQPGINCRRPRQCFQSRLRAIRYTG
jgi:CRISPR/Cas system CMR subunit Cmr6 (Cas7 group RAMP superfamily)